MDFTFSTEQEDFRAAVRSALVVRGALRLRPCHDRGPRRRRPRSCGQRWPSSGGSVCSCPSPPEAWASGWSTSSCSRRSWASCRSPGPSCPRPWPPPWPRSASASTMCSKTWPRAGAGAPWRWRSPATATRSAPCRRAPPPTATEWVLEGTKPLVLDGAHADFAFVVARDGDGLATFLLDAPAGDPVPALDVTRKLSRVELDGRRARRVGPPGDHEEQWRRVLDDLNVAVMRRVGGHLRACPRTGGGVRQGAGAVRSAHRHLPGHQAQGGRHAPSRRAGPGGHALRGVGLGRRRPRARRAAAMCKGYVAEAADFVTAESIQVHGGVGFTWDVDCHLLYRRAKQDDLLFGAQGFQRQRLADLSVGIAYPLNTRRVPTTVRNLRVCREDWSAARGRANDRLFFEQLGQAHGRARPAPGVAQLALGSAAHDLLARADRPHRRRRACSSW